MKLRLKGLVAGGLAALALVFVWRGSAAASSEATGGGLHATAEIVTAP